MGENMASGIVIRPPTSSDAQALGRLGALLVSTHHGFDKHRFLEPGPSTPALYAHYLEGELQNPDKLVIVAVQKGQVAGYIYAGLEGTDYMALRGPAGAVFDLIVDPACRRTGIGKHLLRAAISVLVKRGAPRVVLFTAEKNDIAQPLFENAGCRATMIEMTLEPEGH